MVGSRFNSGLWSLLLLALTAFDGCLSQNLDYSTTVKPTWYPEQCRVAASRVTCSERRFRRSCPNECVYTCPAPFTRDDVDCFAANNKEVAFYEAAVLCKAYSGTLGLANVAERNNEITVRIGNSVSPSNLFWIGGAYISTGQTGSSFLWYDQAVPTTFTSWLNTRPSANFAGITKNGQNGGAKWQDETLTNNYRYVCYRAATFVSSH